MAVIYSITYIGQLYVSVLLAEKVFIFNPTSKEDINSVINLADDKLILGGFLFDEALILAKNRRHKKPSPSGVYYVIVETGIIRVPKKLVLLS